jgi:hypothetical protein
VKVQSEAAKISGMPLLLTHHQHGAGRGVDLQLARDRRLTIDAVGSRAARVARVAMAWPRHFQSTQQTQPSKGSFVAHFQERPKLRQRRGACAVPHSLTDTAEEVSKAGKQSFGAGVRGGEVEHAGDLHRTRKGLPYSARAVTIREVVRRVAVVIAVLGPNLVW